MRVGWINDFNFDDYLGGACITNKLMIEKGIELGHEIDQINTETKHDWRHDLYIINNVTGFNDLYFKIFKSPYIVYCHDLSYQNRGWLFDDSILNVFLSPYHLKVYRKEFRIKVNGVCVPSPLDPNIEKHRREKIGGLSLFVGEIREDRGILDLVDRADVLFIGRPDDESILKQIKDRYLGYLSNEDTLSWVARAETLIFRPKFFGSFGRVVAEALALGCELDCNENVGALSYGGNLVDRCKAAPVDFWKEVTSAYESANKRQN